jgi:hypothetical protein
MSDGLTTIVHSLAKVKGKSKKEKVKKQALVPASAICGGMKKGIAHTFSFCLFPFYFRRLDFAF